VSHGAFPATCARPASRMHFHEAYNSCSFYSVAAHTDCLQIKTSIIITDYNTN
jgi:hypothetical protein